MYSDIAISMPAMSEPGEVLSFLTPRHLETVTLTSVRHGVVA